MQTPVKDSLLRTPNDKWKDVSHKKNLKYQEDKTSHGKFAQVILGKFSPRNEGFVSPNIALKTQHIHKPKDLSDVGYRELLIFKQLNSLKKDNECHGFVGVYDWFKSKGSIYEDESQFMNIVLEKADDSLRKYLLGLKYTIPLNEYKCMLFQILYSLEKAQSKFQFVHHDLHLDNIMIKYLTNNVKETVYYVGEKRYSCKVPYMIKITDFGLSRITISKNQIIYNPKRGDAFDPSIDLIQLSIELKKIKINWKDEENEESEKKKLGDLKRKLKKISNVNVMELVQHPFFDSLVLNHDLEDSVEMMIFGRPVEETKKILFEEKEEEKENIRIEVLFDKKEVGKTIVKSRKMRKKSLNPLVEKK